MPDIPYPLQNEEWQDFQKQMLDIVRDLYENRIGGALEGDVFKVQGDVLELKIKNGSALRKVNGELDVDLSGATPGSAGLRVSLFNAKGVLLVGKAKDYPVALPSSADGYVLRVDHTTESGLAWGNTVNGLTITASTGTLTITNSKTLTVEDDSLVNQDLTTDAQPTFAQLAGLGVPDANGEAIRQTAKITEALLESATDLKHTQGTDTTLGNVTANINMNTHKLTSLAVPADVGDSIRATTKITESNLEDAVDKKHVAVTVSAPVSLSGQALSLVNNAGSPATVTTIDIDGTLAGNSDVYVPTQKAVKTYADTKLAKASNLSDVSNAATAFSNIKQAATDSATGVVELPTDAETIAFADTSRAVTPSNLGYVLQKSYNHVNYAKGRLLDRILANGAGLYTTLSNIKGLWLFDQTGATSTISDRSGNSHDITLRDGSLNAINASTCSPGVTGLAPYLTLDATHLWNIEDSDDFSFVEPAKFSTILLGTATLGAVVYFGKYSEVTGSTQMEWLFYIATNGTLQLLLYDDSANKYIARSTNAGAVTANTLFTVIATNDGSATTAGEKIYRNSSQVDTGSSGTGYTAMENKNAKVASYYLNAAGAVTSPYLGKMYLYAIIAEELTQAQITNWDRLLRSYAGIAL